MIGLLRFQQLQKSNMNERMIAVAAIAAATAATASKERKIKRKHNGR